MCRSIWNGNTGLQEVPSAQKKAQPLSRLRGNELLLGCESPGVRSSPVFLLFRFVAPRQDQEKALDKYEAVVKSLQERSQQVLPLRYRRQPPPQPVPVEALCEYEGEQVRPSSARGDARGDGAGSGTGGTSSFSPAWWWLLQGERGKGRPRRGGKSRFCSRGAGGIWGKRSLAASHPPWGCCDSTALSHSHAPRAAVPARSRPKERPAAAGRSQPASPHAHRHRLSLGRAKGLGQRGRRPPRQRQAGDRARQLQPAQLPASPTRKGRARPWNRPLISARVGTRSPWLSQEAGLGACGLWQQERAQERLARARAAGQPGAGLGAVPALPPPLL